ncbi:MAG: hypothetical protein INR71_10275, partial [Terriglobus roseus]|nr:hypothetical protein [Terriglobus roseus]
MLCIGSTRFASMSLAAGVALALLPSLCHAQVAPQVYGVCAYTLDQTEYFSNVFGTATSYEGPANKAFRDYATAQAAGKPLKNAGCRFQRTEQAAADIKETDKRLLGMTGHAQKSAETGWQFTTVAVQTTTTTTTTVRPTVPTAQSATEPASNTATAATTRTAMASNSNAANARTAIARTAGTAQTAATTNATTTPAATTASTGIGSIATTTTDTLKGAQTTTTTAVTNSVNGITTTTVNGLTTSATNMMTGLQSRIFNHKKKAATPDATATPAAANAAAPAVTTTVATTAVPQPNGSTPVQVTTTTTSGGIGFYFCHLKAGSSEYHSGIFPGTAADQTAASTGFWRQVTQQYKLSNVPFMGNVSCTFAPSEADASTQLKTWEDGAGQRGTGGHVVDTA